MTLLVALCLAGATPLPMETLTVASVSVNEILMDDEVNYRQRSNERVITWRRVPVSWSITAKEGPRICVVHKRPKVGDRVACDWKRPNASNDSKEEESR